MIKRVLIVVLYLSTAINQTLALENIKPEYSFSQQQITASIDQIIGLLETNYIFPEKSTLIANKLTYKLNSNEFNHLKNADDFIHYLDVFIRDVSGDNYLNVMKTSFDIEVSQMLNDSTAAQQNSDNYGFEQLSTTDAIIIDLRDVEGDSILLAQYMMSYFVESNMSFSRPSSSTGKLGKLVINFCAYSPTPIFSGMLCSYTFTRSIPQLGESFFKI